MRETTPHPPHTFLLLLLFSPSSRLSLSNYKPQTERRGNTQQDS